MFSWQLSSTDPADVSPGEAHQCGEPVGDVQQSCGDSSPAPQQRAVDERHSADSTFPVRTLETQSGRLGTINWELLYSH